MALIKNYHRPGSLRLTMPGELVILGPGRPSGAGRRRSEEGFRALVIDQRHLFWGETTQRHGSAPLRHPALGADDQYVVLRHCSQRSNTIFPMTLPCSSSSWASAVRSN